METDTAENENSEPCTALLDDSRQALIALTLEGAVLRGSRSAIATFGFSAQEAVGRDLAELIMPSAGRDDLRLPRSDAAAGGASAPPSFSVASPLAVLLLEDEVDTPAMNQPLILVIDDNPQNLKLTQVLRTRHEYMLHTAVDAESALELLRSIEPDLTLVDLQLPGIDGLALTRQLKADPRIKQIVIIALTAYAMVGDDRRAIAADSDNYGSKPIDTKALPRLIAAYLNRSSCRTLH